VNSFLPLFFSSCGQLFVRKSVSGDRLAVHTLDRSGRVEDRFSTADGS